MRVSYLAALLVGLAFPACSPPEPAAPPPSKTLRASAELKPTEGSQVAGMVTFEETDGQVHVSANVTGLEPGRHGFHIHEIGDCSAPDATSAGGHFNPAGMQHGKPGAGHRGDLGNIVADENGNADYHANLDFITLSPGENSVMGRSVIVHAAEDDLVSQPTGAAGARLACGVIVEP